MQPISILIGALGGEGGGVLAEWLVAAATRAGYPAQGTTIPGVAQRTGATTYYVEIYPVLVAALNGRRPVLGLLPVPGRVDLVVASELLEAARVVQAGVTSPERTLLLTSTSRTLTTAEKMIRAFAPGALVVALGLDASEHDPLAGLAVTTDGFRRIGAAIARLGLPTAFVQEGGYLSEILGTNLTAALAGFEAVR